MGMSRNEVRQRPPGRTVGGGPAPAAAAGARRTEGARIAFVTEVWGWGGSEKYIANMVTGAIARGWQPHVFCPGQHPFITDPARALPSGCAVTPYAVDTSSADTSPAPREAGRSSSIRPAIRRLYRKMVPGDLKLLAGAAGEARRMAALLRGGNFDIAYLGITGCPHVALGIRRAVAGPFVGRFCIVPSDAPGGSSLAHRALEWAALRCFDELIANAVYARETWVRRTKLPPARFHVIYNGIDVNAFVPRRPAETVRAEIGVPAGCPVIGVTARLDLIKGHAYLLRAIPDVIRAVPDAHVVLAGEGRLRSVLERTAEELGIRERVHFLGNRTDVADVTQVYDVAVLPSVAGEGLPHTVLEAMALRKPMVASRFSGIPEEVDDGVTGTLVPPGLS